MANAPKTGTGQEIPVDGLVSFLPSSAWATSESITSLVESNCGLDSPNQDTLSSNQLVNRDEMAAFLESYLTSILFELHSQTTYTLTANEENQKDSQNVFFQL